MSVMSSEFRPVPSSFLALQFTPGKTKNIVLDTGNLTKLLGLDAL